MTTIQDLGEVTETRTEWFSRETRCDGTATQYVGSGDEQQARNLVEACRTHMDTLDEATRRFRGVERADLVSHTVTTYTSGHTLTGPWEVAE